MKTTPACLVLLLAAAACSKEASKTPTPAAKPSQMPAAKPAEAPAAKPAEAPTAPAVPGAGMKLVKTTASETYPLKTCVVSGEELGADRVAYKWGDTEVQFCCPDCVKDFEKEPEKFLAKIPAVAASK
jgi:hypothetical protein